MAATPLTLQPRPAIDPSVDHAIQAIVAALYFCLCDPVSRLSRRLERRGAARLRTLKALPA